MEIIVDRLSREFNLGANIGTPQVAYKETRSERPSERKESSSAVRGPRASSAMCGSKLLPTESGKGFCFRKQDHRRRGSPESSSRPSKRACVEAMEEGVLAGYPVGCQGGRRWSASYHEVDSSEMAFKIAASMGFKSGVKKAHPVLLEPIMSVEVVVPGSTWET